MKPIVQFLEDYYGQTMSFSGELIHGWLLQNRSTLSNQLDQEGYPTLTLPNLKTYDDFFTDVFQSQYPRDAVHLWYHGIYFTNRDIMMLFKLSV